MSRRPSHTARALLPCALCLTLGSGCYGMFFVGSESESDRDGATPPPDVETPPVDSSVSQLAFTNVHCTPPVHLGLSVTADQGVWCTFDVTGPPGQPVSLYCRNAQGNDVNCGPNSWPYMEIEPRGPLAMPLQGLQGDFGMDTRDRSGEHFVLTWVAASGTQEATYRLEFDVEEPQTAQIPTMFATCRGDPDMAVSVPAGEVLTCEVVVDHPDPSAYVDWLINWPSHPALTVEPWPNRGTGTGVFTWYWPTTLNEAGRQFVFTFWVTDQSMLVGTDLIVDVH